MQTNLKVDAWDAYLTDYSDSIVSRFLRYGWPVNYSKSQLPTSTVMNHPSAIQFAEHVQHYIKTESKYQAIAGPFKQNPLHQDLVCSPLQTVPKRDSLTRRVVMDLSFPEGDSVNSGIPSDSYLQEPYKLRLPGIDRLCEFILQHGHGCLIYKKDLKRAYRQIPIDPKDYNLLGFQFNNAYYFDLRCPFGLRSSAMICQRTTSAVVYIFTNLHGYTADVYLDDFYGAERPERAQEAFIRLQELFDDLGLQCSIEKDCAPSTNMICLGIEVDTVDFCLRVPQNRINDLLDELSAWKSKKRYRIKELQSLLGKLSFVTACVPAGRIFMSRLLNNLRNITSRSARHLVTQEMKQDINWWLEFLPKFNGVSLIKSPKWVYDDLNFTTDACLSGGGAICLDQCMHFTFTPEICEQAGHISALELFVIVVAARCWSSLLQHRRVLVSCDNQAAVDVINSGFTKDHFMQRCLRQLWWTSALHDFEIRATHIPGAHNSIADALSRWELEPRYRNIFHNECQNSNVTLNIIDFNQKILHFEVN